jgi:periplasmic copper chaperone A
MPIRRTAAVIILAAAVVVAVAPAALAHVTVDPEQAPQGGFATLTFHVPTERDDASTVKVEVKIPQDHPIASVSVQPKPGWTYQITTTKLATPVTTDDGATITDAVSQITWQGGAIKPGEFDEFSVALGPLPDSEDSLLFPAIQTYSDGQEVAWIETSAPGQPEPDHPAPELKLTAAAENSSSSSSTSSSSNSDTPAPGTTVVKKESNNGLAVAALVVGVVGLGLGGVALSRSARR